MSGRRRDLELVEEAMVDFERLAMDVRLDAVVATQLSIQQLKVLMLAVHRAPVTAHEVSAALGVSPATVSGIVGRLVDRGLLVQETDPDDRRSRHLTATEAGAAALTEIASIQLAHRRVLLERLTAEELEGLLAGVRGLGRALAELVEATP